MKLAATTGHFAPYCDPEGCVRQFAGTGFRYLDYNFYEGKHPVSYYTEGGMDRDVDNSLRAAKELGMTFMQAHAPGVDPLAEGEKLREQVHIVEETIRACGKMGIPRMVVHSGFPRNLPYPQGMDEYMERNRPFYRMLRPAMEKYGVEILIENSTEQNSQGNCFFMTGREMADFIRFADVPMLHACWDIGHANMRTDDQYREILDLGKELRALHIHDNFGDADIHIMPLTGTVNMDGILRGLLDTGYEGWFTFEVNHVFTEAGAWPIPRRKAPAGVENRLLNPTVELVREGQKLLYQVGRYLLTAYDCFEE